MINSGGNLLSIDTPNRLKNSVRVAPGKTTCSLTPFGPASVWSD